MSLTYFNKNTFENIAEKTVTTDTGVRCGFSGDIFTENAYRELTENFPNLTQCRLVDKKDSGGGHKRFYVGPEYVITRNYGSVYHLRNLPPVWQNLLKEVSSPEFIESLSKATRVEFNTLCNFGIGYGNEGCIQEPHLDGAIRDGDQSWIKGNIAFLLYFNENPDPISATEIYGVDRKTILFKGTTMRNSLLFFKQHPNAWHGFPLVPKGHTRRILSIAYANTPQPLNVKWTLMGLFFSKLKKYFPKLI